MCVLWDKYDGDGAAAFPTVMRHARAQRKKTGRTADVLCYLSLSFVVLCFAGLYYAWSVWYGVAFLACIIASASYQTIMYRRRRAHENRLRAALGEMVSPVPPIDFADLKRGSK